MIKRSTWILLILLVLAVGAYFLLQKSSGISSEPTPTAPGSNFLVTEADGKLLNLRISDSQNRVVQILRDPSGVWVVAIPTQGKADQALAQAADTQVGALRIITILETTPDLGVIKLDSPASTIELKFDSGVSHTLEVGSLTATGNGYYVRFDGGKIYIISQAGIDSLLNLLIAPPYPPTEIPSATVEPTATPVTETLTPTP